MFVPLHDDTPLKVIRFQFVTLTIILGNVIIFLMTGAFQSDQMLAGIATSFGVVPSEFILAPSQNIPFSPIPEPLTFLTYMFLHASWMHLISNMLFLWVFADNVEDAFGYFAFVLFYLLCGIAGALAHVLMTPNVNRPAHWRIRCRFRCYRRLCAALSQGPRLDSVVFPYSLAHFSHMGFGRLVPAADLQCSDNRGGRRYGGRLVGPYRRLCGGPCHHIFAAFTAAYPHVWLRQGVASRWGMSVAELTCRGWFTRFRRKFS